MNSGIAKQIREKWPIVFQNYIAKCNFSHPSGYVRPEVLLGDIQFVPLYEDYNKDIKHQQVINMFGQYGYGYEGGGAEMFLQKDKGSGQQTECGHRLFRWSGPDDGEQYAAGNHAEGEGGQQSVAIEAELLFLSLPDELHRIQFALKAVHEVITVLEVRGIAVEQLGQSVVFFHHLFMFCFKWSRPRESCFFTASSLQSTMRAISFIAYPFM